jgi:glycosyltransferase involved in cell wall biosynthesis
MVCHLYDRALHWRQPILDLGYPVESLRMSSIRDLPRGVVRLLRLLKQHPVDLIHTHLYGANLVGRLAAAMAGVPVVSSLHNPDYEPATLRDNPALSPAKSWILRGLDRLSCRLARPAFVAVSEYVKQSAVTYLGIASDQVVVIYNPIDLATFRRSAETVAAGIRGRAELGLGADDPVIVCVARLDPQKGLRYLIEAMPSLVRQFPSAVALFVGGGSSSAKASLEGLADALQVRPHVRLLGVQADVRPYLDMCDVFVLPSLYEGMGISLVEAMAMERACVATRATAVPEVVDDEVSGVLVAPADSAAVATAIARLLKDAPLRGRMGAEGRRIALERFDVAKNIGQLESVYRRVARERGAA